MATTGGRHSSTTIVRRRPRRDPLVAGHLAVVTHPGAAAVGRLAPEGNRAAVVDRAERPVKDLFRRRVLEARAHLELSIVQMKTTRSGSASPNASESPLEFRSK
jgi:hypothetical protein